MGKVIAVANQKGGCGKTITSINLAASLAFLGKSVLLLDLDSQAHSSLGLGVDPEGLEKSLFDVFDLSSEEKTNIEDVTLGISRNLDLAPAHVILSAIEQKLAGVDGREKILSEKINTVKSKYDFIVVDCSPNLGLLTFNALVAADAVLVPVEPSYFAVHGLKKLIETISLVREIVDHPIDAYSLVTMFDNRTKHARVIADSIKSFFGENNLKAHVRKNIRLQDAAQHGKAITEFDKNSNGFKDYVNVAVELIEKCRSDKREEVKSFAEAIETDHGIQNLLESLDAELAALCEHLDDHECSISEAWSDSAEHENTEAVINSVAGNEAVAVAQKETTFFIDAPGANSVAIAGCFNNWQPQEMDVPEKDGMQWSISLPLESGTYQYKFIVDGVWVIDPVNTSRITNQYAEENSLITVDSE